MTPQLQSWWERLTESGEETMEAPEVRRLPFYAETGKPGRTGRVGRRYDSAGPGCTWRVTGGQGWGRRLMNPWHRNPERGGFSPRVKQRKESLWREERAIGR